MQKAGIVFEVDAKDYRWNIKAGVAAFYFLYWKYVLLLVFMVETVRNICFAKKIFC